MLPTKVFINNNAFNEEKEWFNDITMLLLESKYHIDFDLKHIKNISQVLMVCIIHGISIGATTKGVQGKG